MLLRAKEPDEDLKASSRSELRRTAKRLLQSVAEAPGDYQELAKKRLSELP